MRRYEVKAPISEIFCSRNDCPLIRVVQLLLTEASAGKFVVRNPIGCLFNGKMCLFQNVLEFG